MSCKKPEGNEALFYESQGFGEELEEYIKAKLETWWEPLRAKLDGCTNSAYNMNGIPYLTFCIKFRPSTWQTAFKLFIQDVEEEIKWTTKFSARTKPEFFKERINCPCCGLSEVGSFRVRVRFFASSISEFERVLEKYPDVTGLRGLFYGI